MWSWVIFCNLIYTSIYVFTNKYVEYAHYLKPSHTKKSINQSFCTSFFFRNDVLPIVMGAAPEDYARAAPYHSYIHVDEFETPKDLAEYLHKLDNNDTLYNEYFRWKGTGSNVNTFFWCRICSMIHEVGENTHPVVYRDLDRWWRGPGVCIGQTRWRENAKARSKIIIDKYGTGVWYKKCRRAGWTQCRILIYRLSHDVSRDIPVFGAPQIVRKTFHSFQWDLRIAGWLSLWYADDYS